jgi:hypothetical protein
MNLRNFAGCLLAAVCAVAAVPARANDDTVHIGSNIEVAPDATVRDAVCIFCSVNVEGKVNGDVVVLFGSIHIAGVANRDVVNIFGGVRADDGASIGRDLVNLFGSVRLGENVTVGHDMVALFSSARVAKSATVIHDRVVQPGWVFDVPLIIMIVVLVLIVREYRAYRRRQFFLTYPFLPPPRP